MDKKKTTPWAIAILVLGILFIGSAGALYLHNLQEESAAQVSATTTLTAIAQEFTKQTQEISPLEVAPAQVAPLPDITESYHQLEEMPVLVVDGSAYVGVLELPTLGLELPILGSCSDNNLKLAPCCYGGSVYTHDMVIAGHNYTTHFASLQTLAPGDSIYFIDMEQTSFPYTVVETELVQPTDIEEMATADTWDLTLFTCSYNGNMRIAVRCAEKTDDALPQAT